jgi:protein-disulfide isomerase-like protein with CxxC motif
MLENKEIIYVGEPMCSWCWGFSPVLRQLLKTFNFRKTSVSTYEEFIAVRRLGVQGFPSLLARREEHHESLARSYKPLDQMHARIAAWLAAE